MVSTKPTPLVSVLMPAYNHGAFIAAAVGSVLTQTHGNLELIAIDDASADDTWAILQAFDDPRIKLRRHDRNRGAHATLNEALQLANGEFITIINSDDIFAPGRIASCLEELEANGADLIGTDIILINGAGERITEHWWLTAFDKLKQVQAETGDWLATLLEGNVFITTSNFFFRRGWFESVGEFHDLRYVLDYEWLLRGLVGKQRLAWLDQPLLSYRLHESNTISERPLAANLECSLMLRNLLPALLSNAPMEKTRLEHLASQWSRIERYLGEISDTRRHEALLAKENELFPLIEDRDRWIRERDLWIAERDALISERNAWISERDQRIKEYEARLTEVELVHSKCQEDLRQLQDSLSFRIGRFITSPGRWFRSLSQTRGSPE